MSLRLMLITLSAAMITVQAVDYTYRTVLVKGDEGNTDLEKSLAARIPSSQCDASLEFPRDYKCSPEGGAAYPPRVLKVEVLDNVGPAMIRIDNKLKGIRIYRVTDHASHCLSEALVQLYLGC